MLSLIYFLVRNLRFGAYGSRIRCAILRRMGVKIGSNTFIGPNITIVHPECLTIGNNVSIHQDCYIDAIGKVVIGNDISIAHQVSILSFNHKFDNPSMPIRNQGIETKEITIDDDVWIGCKAVLLPGTHIKSRTVVAAMALCNKKYSGHEIIGGIPAHHIKEI